MRKEPSQEELRGELDSLCCGCEFRVRCVILSQPAVFSYDRSDRIGCTRQLLWMIDSLIINANK